MGRSGGTYTAPSNSFNPAVTGTSISSTAWNAILADLEAALTASIAKDGQTPTTAVIPFASGISTDTIAEVTGGVGVTIDSVLLKDGRVDFAKGGDIASASSIDLGATTGNYVDITGTTTITALGTSDAGVWRIAQFDGALTLTHNATSLILPTAANITTAAGDHAAFVSLGSGNWRCVSYQRKSGQPLTLGAMDGSSLTGITSTQVSGVLEQGIHTIWVPAAAMVAPTTSGAAIGNEELATNDVMLNYFAFDAAADRFVQFFIRMPKSWDEGTITASFTYHQPAAGSGNVVWGLQGVALADSDAGDSAWGSAKAVADTAGTEDDIFITSATSAITIAGSPAAEELVAFRVFRDADSGSDTLTADTNLLGVTLYITIDASDDS